MSTWIEFIISLCVWMPNKMTSNQTNISIQFFWFRCFNFFFYLIFVDYATEPFSSKGKSNYTEVSIYYIGELRGNKIGIQI